MANWRTYSTATRAALAVLSQGPCYFPGCGTPIVVFVGGQPEVNVETVRIRAADQHGSRFAAELSDDAANSFDNLLLLCVAHRKTIERDEKAHPADLLEMWKARREASGHAALREVGTLPERQIDDLLITAFAAVQEQIDAALAQFEQSDPEAAELVRRLVNGLHEQRNRAGADIQRLDAVTAKLGDLVRTLDSRPKRRNIGWSS